MADHGTAIEWTQAPGFKGETWNPVTGCDRVSPGCAHCYALDLAAKFKGWGQPRYQKDGDSKTSGPGFGLTLHPDKLRDPLRWRKPRMVFVNSMSDLFHEEIPEDFIAQVFAAMGAASQHVFQVLTKRPERMHDLLNDERFHDDVRHYLVNEYREQGWEDAPLQWPGWPFDNVWLGVTIENRLFVHRADLLRETPAAVRFISAEPLLGPLTPTFGPEVDWQARWLLPGGREIDAPDLLDEGLQLTEIDWLIVGGESGPSYRPVNPRWVRDLRDLAHFACDVPFFFKQWGGRTPKAGGRELDGRTWSEFPAVLQGDA